MEHSAHLTNDTMNRNHYKIFSEGCIAVLTISNRLTRSATWDPSILTSHQMTDEVLELYRNLALGGIGAIITVGFPEYRDRFPEEDLDQPIRLYADLRVNGMEEMVRFIHQARRECKIIAQTKNYISRHRSGLLHGKAIFDKYSALMPSYIHLIESQAEKRRPLCYPKRKDLQLKKSFKTPSAGR